jgi:ATP-dependent Clp protease, protease subunit
MRKLLNLLMKNQQTNKQCSIKNEGGTLSIFIDGVIDADWGISANDVVAALNGFNGDKINIYLNSPGGSVFEARSMVSKLSRVTAHKTVFIDGLAASSASWLALAADEVVMCEGTRFMIHNAWSITLGSAKDMRDTADVLDSLDNTFVDDYMAAVKKRGKNTSREQLRAYLDAETWFTPEMALDVGFIDRIEGKKRGDASNFDLTAYNNAPEPERNEAAVDESIAQLIARNERHLRIIGTK